MSEADSKSVAGPPVSKIETSIGFIRDRHTQKLRSIHYLKEKLAKLQDEDGSAQEIEEIQQTLTQRERELGQWRRESIVELRSIAYVRGIELAEEIAELVNVSELDEFREALAEKSYSAFQEKFFGHIIGKLSDLIEDTNEFREQFEDFSEESDADYSAAIFSKLTNGQQPVGEVTMIHSQIGIELIVDSPQDFSTLYNFRRKKNNLAEDDGLENTRGFFRGRYVVIGDRTVVLPVIVVKKNIDDFDEVLKHEHQHRANWLAMMAYHQMGVGWVEEIYRLDVNYKTLQVIFNEYSSRPDLWPKMYGDEVAGGIEQLKAENERVKQRGLNLAAEAALNMAGDEITSDFVATGDLGHITNIVEHINTGKKYDFVGSLATNIALFEDPNFRLQVEERYHKQLISILEYFTGLISQAEEIRLKEELSRWLLAHFFQHPVAEWEQRFKDDNLQVRHLVSVLASRQSSQRMGIDSDTNWEIVTNHIKKSLDLGMSLNKACQLAMNIFPNFFGLSG